MKWWSKSSKEIDYIHWTNDKPINQVQFSFKNNYSVFRKIIKKYMIEKGKCIEYGCGRGNMSLFFANDGWDCTLVDNSKIVIDKAKEIFQKKGLKGNFLVNDILKKKIKKKYDVTFSIGLLEHIPKLSLAVRNHIDVLRSGGVFLLYIVPENNPKVQQNWNWLNNILKLFSPSRKTLTKPNVFRSPADINQYRKILSHLDVIDVNASGLYPLPMISHSIEFPFSLNNKLLERFLVFTFYLIMKFRKIILKKQEPWLCDESFGQAFLVWGKKK